MSTKEELLADYYADWLIDAVGGATQNRALLRGDPAEDEVLTQAIVMNGRKAILNALNNHHASAQSASDPLYDSRNPNHGRSGGLYIEEPSAPSPARPSREAIKRVATDFFRWWWNKPGSNTDQCFDEWANGPGADAILALAPIPDERGGV